MKFRKWAAIIAVLFTVTAVLCGIGSVMAYLADGDKAENPFSIGNNTITVEEPFEPVVPGKKTVKRPSAVNTGTIDCYVRAKILLSDSRAGSYITYYHNSTKGMNVKDWKQDLDGWLYYNRSIAPGEQTPALFTHIELKQEIPEGMKDVAIDVVFESVQSDGFEDPKTAFQSIEGNRNNRKEAQK